MQIGCQLYNLLSVTSHTTPMKTVTWSKWSWSSSCASDPEEKLTQTIVKTATNTPKRSAIRLKNRKPSMGVMMMKTSSNSNYYARKFSRSCNSSDLITGTVKALSVVFEENLDDDEFIEGCFRYFHCELPWLLCYLNFWWCANFEGLIYRVQINSGLLAWDSTLSHSYGSMWVD